MSEARNTPEQCIVLVMRRVAIPRRQQRVQLKLGVSDRLAHGETNVAQSRSRDRDQQGLDRHQPCREIGKARFNQFCRENGRRP